MTNFPSSLDSTGSTLPTVATGTDFLSSSANKRHDTKHNMEDGAIIAVETKIGTGSSTPTSGTILYGTGSGTSAWTAANLGAWTDFTPTCDQGGAVAITVTYARYQVVGKKVDIMFRVVCTGSGSAGNHVSLSAFPTGSAAPKYTGTNRIGGSGQVVHAGSATYHADIELSSSGTVSFMGTGTSVDYIGSAPSVALAANDIIDGTLSYEAA